MKRLLSITLMLTFLIPAWSKKKENNPQWISAPTSTVNWKDNATYTTHFRHTFKLKKLPKQIPVEIASSSEFTLWINNYPVLSHEKAKEGDTPIKYKLDLSKYFYIGENTIAIELDEPNKDIKSIPDLGIYMSIGVSDSLLAFTNKLWSVCQNSAWTTDKNTSYKDSKGLFYNSQKDFLADWRIFTIKPPKNKDYKWQKVNVIESSKEIKYKELSITTEQLVKPYWFSGITFPYTLRNSETVMLNFPTGKPGLILLKVESSASTEINIFTDKMQKEGSRYNLQFSVGIQSIVLPVLVSGEKLFIHSLSTLRLIDIQFIQ